MCRRVSESSKRVGRSALREVRIIYNACRVNPNTVVSITTVNTTVRVNFNFGFKKGIFNINTIGQNKHKK